MREREHDRYWHTQMRDLQWTAVILAVLGLVWWAAQGMNAVGAGASAPAVATPASAPAAGRVWLVEGTSGEQVRAVQTYLVHHGWSLDVDGQYGPRTEAVVARVQAMSGLVADGIVGPVTWEAFGLDRPANVGQQADRVEGQIIVTAAPPPPSSARCPEWWDELTALSPGWDVARMDGIMYRESRCRPGVTSNTGCCHGLLQVHQMHVPRLGVCGVDSAGDLFDAGKNICAAAVLFRESGYNPWNL